MNYFINGFAPPSGVSSREQVRDLQNALIRQGANIKADGIYGAKTANAYNSMGGGTAAKQSYVPEQYKNYFSEFKELLQPPTLSYTPSDRGELVASIKQALRPGYDAAIKQRQKATLSQKAELEADAYARGMGKSTYLSDVKDRQSNYEADDVSALESQYAAAEAAQLLGALQNEKSQQFAADQFNAQMGSSARTQALGLAGDFYGQYLSENGSGRGGRGRSGAGSTKKTAQGYDPYEELVNELNRSNSSAGAAYNYLNKNKGNLVRKYGQATFDEARAGVVEQYSSIYDKNE